jgi:hypothetical protein
MLRDTAEQRGRPYLCLIGARAFFYSDGETVAENAGTNASRAGQFAMGMAKEKKA